MAIKKQAAVKSTDNVKATGKSAPAKAVAETSASKNLDKKAASAKSAKTAPVEKVAEKPVPENTTTKNATVKKAETKSATTENKPEAKKVAEIKEPAAKKAEQEKKPAQKTEADKKTAPKGTEAADKKTVTKKPEPEKKAAEVPEKKSATPAKKETPVKVESKPEPVVEKTEAVRKPAKPPVKKVIPASSLDRRAVAAKAASAVVPATRPMATPAARTTEKKPNVIIAHRRMENKSKHDQVPEELPSYQPEIYRSLLDEPAPPPVTVYRYNDEDLMEFRELISNRLEAARKELIYLQGVITRKDEAGTEDTENRYMNIEDGSGAMEREQLAQLASRQIQFVNHLEKALIRIENKTYGICRVTGKLIEKARLRAVPHATLSIEAKKMMNTKQN